METIPTTLSVALAHLSKTFLQKVNVSGALFFFFFFALMESDVVAQMFFSHLYVSVVLNAKK